MRARHTKSMPYSAPVYLLQDERKEEEEEEEEEEVKEVKIKKEENKKKRRRRRKKTEEEKDGNLQPERHVRLPERARQQQQRLGGGEAGQDVGLGGGRGDERRGATVCEHRLGCVTWGGGRERER